MVRAWILGMALLASLVITASTAQAQLSGHFEGDAAVALGFPQGELADNVDNVGFGGHLTAGWALADAPLFLGLNLGALGYGRETRHEPFSTTIPDVTVKVTTTNSIFYGHAVLRVGPTAGPFRPFVDGLIGFKNFYTKTKIQNEDDAAGEEPIAESKNLDDTALSYGFGGGLRYRVASLDVNETEKGSEDAGGNPRKVKTGEVHLYLTAGVWYLFGGEAQYLKEGSIARGSGGTVTYDINESSTDMVMAYLGISASL